LNKSSIDVAGIIGNPVERSLSPAMHNAAFRAAKLDWVYIPFMTETGHLDVTVEVLKTLGLKGFNVTMPFKKEIIRYLDSVSSEAEAIMSVNTVVNESGRLAGYSTDGEGFMMSIEARGESIDGKKIAVIGAGGAARAIVFEIAKGKAKEVSVINRTHDKAETLRDIITRHHKGYRINAMIMDRKAVKTVRAADMVINTTPLGKQTLEGLDFLVDGLGPDQFIYDLTTVPPLSQFLVTARQRGCRVMGGLGMLVYQGALSYKMWTGMEAPVGVMMKAVGMDDAGIEVVRHA
jgi:shikimate dehydrogenase